MSDTLPRAADTVSELPELPQPPKLHAELHAGARVTATVLGRGGMGEVVLARDERVGRDVALKRMRGAAPSAEALARFLREARIQARLEHPAIVPVYDLGRDADGAPYFTMKRLAGTTLHEKIGASSREALLRTFVDVCRALDFAHSRGVVHRDLKPSNIMLGDFGEVYVLDWGVARVLGAPAEALETEEAARAEFALAADDIATLDSQTQVGAVLGTPGYMPPEQLAGQEVTAAADIYALGSILFELLAQEPLHPRGDGALGSTLTTPTAAPAGRRPELAIPPELDACCVAALAEAPADRPTARALADRVQRYLDGDRDLERRRALAERELAAARDAVASDDPARRADAVAAAGRALALDPESKPAAELVSSLMLAPPAAMPPELVAELAEVDRGLAVAAARGGALSIAAFLLFVPMLAIVHVTSWAAVAAVIVGATTLSGAAFVMARRGRVHVVPFVIAYHVFMLALGRSFGPWILIPGLIALTSAAMISLPQLLDRAWLLLGLAFATLAAPFALEATGVLAPTWSFGGGELVLRSGMLDFDGRGALIFLVAAHVAMILVNMLLARTLARSRRDAHHRAEMQAWHLRKLVPGQARPRA